MKIPQLATYFTIIVLSSPVFTGARAETTIKEERVSPEFVCKDYINEWGIRYGGCYDRSKGEVIYVDPGRPSKVRCESKPELRGCD